MSQGNFTKEEGKETKDAVEEMYAALTKKRQMEYLGHYNDIMLYLSASIEQAPKERSDSEGDV